MLRRYVLACGTEWNKKKLKHCHIFIILLSSTFMGSNLYVHGSMRVAGLPVSLNLFLRKPRVDNQAA